MARRLDGVRLVRGGRRMGATLAAAVVAGTAVADLVLMNAVGHTRAHDAARDDAMKSARELVPVLLSYDYRTLNGDLARARKTTTSAFRGDFDKLVTSVVSPTAAERQVSTHAVVSGAGVVSSSSSRVTILVFVTQTSSSAGKSPVVTGSRVKVLMAKTAAGWRIAGLDPV